MRQGSLQKHNHHGPRRLLVATLLVVVVTLTACGEQPAPLSEWEVTWRNTISTVEQAGTPDVTQQVCEETLAYLRVQRTVVSPVPLEDLETPVDEWFAEAEAMFFECDLDDEATEESLETLQALEAEVETVLELER